jgi:hypothetical protein
MFATYDAVAFSGHNPDLSQEAGSSVVSTLSPEAGALFVEPGTIYCSRFRKDHHLIALYLHHPAGIRKSNSGLPEVRIRTEPGKEWK